MALSPGLLAELAWASPSPQAGLPHCTPDPRSLSCSCISLPCVFASVGHSVGPEPEGHTGGAQPDAVLPFLVPGCVRECLGAREDARLVEMMGGACGSPLSSGRAAPSAFSVRLGTVSPNPEDAATDATGPAPAQKGCSRPGAGPRPPRRALWRGACRRQTWSRASSPRPCSPRSVLQRSSSRISAPPLPSGALGPGEEESLSAVGTRLRPTPRHAAPASPPSREAPCCAAKAQGGTQPHDTLGTPAAAGLRADALAPLSAYSSGALASASPRPARQPRGPRPGTSRAAGSAGAACLTT